MPLPRPLWLRLTAVAVVLVGAFAAACVAMLWFFFTSMRTCLAVLGLAGLSLVAVWPLLTGRWARGVLILPIAIAVVGYVGLSAFAAEQAREGLMSRTVHATPSSELAAWTALALAAVLASTVVVSALPIRGGRRLRTGVSGVLVLSGLAGAGTAVAIAAEPDPCPRFRFDRAAWLRDPQPVGEALVRCRTLEGLDKRQLRRMLGRASTGLSPHVWVIGLEDDFGFGTYELVAVEFGGDNRVRSARLAYWHR
jgi:hypothetical protein